VFFSRETRDNYGQVAGDYSGDYGTSCLSLTRAGITCDVVTNVPDPGKLRFLVVSSAGCLSTSQRDRLARFMQAGGTVIATGPTGFYDARANAIANPWLAEFGIAAEVSEPSRPGGFPPYEKYKTPVELSQCRVSEAVQRQMNDGWVRVAVGKGELLWRPERISQKTIADSVIKLLRARSPGSVQLAGLAGAWQLRQFREANRILIHALPAKVETVLHPTLTNQMGGQRLVEKLVFAKLTTPITISTSLKLGRLTLHSPDLTEGRSGTVSSDGKWSVDPNGVSRYFVLELECQA